MNLFHQNSDAERMLERDREWLLPVYARFPIVMERGEGVYLFDTSGNRYLDMMAGLGVNALGHAHPRMVRATADQARMLVHLSPQYCTPYAGELAERLCALSGMEGVFYSTGGSEAVEGAIKVARAYAAEAFGPHKHRIVSLLGSYHGRTLGSLAVTGQTKYRDNFGPDLPGVDFVVRDDLASLQAAVSDETCCILIETVLGEGGVYEVSPEFLAEARRLADKHHALLVLDEIQCGLGRTGDWFAFPRIGVKPDVLILGKPLGGGIPLSALLVTGPLFHALGLGKHGSTLGGSPMACRLGLEFLSVVEDEGLLARVTDTGAYLRTHLDGLARELDIAMEARGIGLIQGLELSIPGRPIAESALEQGLMLNFVQGNVMRFLPSFLLERQHVDTAMEIIRPLLHKANREAKAEQPELVAR
ncbi:aspartate aminotransferase family protein [Terriglobus aquaticus]|uniref:Aspartate aminotransferase family protein n=1 Tax=Terriglobus aquaticus TaxID=940139 RepID=A0ABW9KJ99_9BACT|nr:acetylornithine transaminase [Terriglobus aquaticus]